MIIKNFEDISAVPVAMAGAENVKLREVLTARENAPNFALRVFDLEPGGFTPHHDHDYEHEVFVLSGQGEVTEGETVHQLTSGSVVLMMPGVPHQFRNSGDEMFRFICLIPNQS